MKTLDVAALALNIALYVALGYIFYTLVPIKFEQVRFWPPVIVPAVFAVVFGPLVGGLGAAIGIFLSDIMLGGDPLLSLMAGVTSNFAAFYLIGYIAKKKTSWKIPVVGYGVATVLLMGVAYTYANFLFMAIVAICYGVFLLPIVFFKNSKWHSFAVGSITGMLVGAAIIGVMVPVFFQFLASAATPFTAMVALTTFFFTFFTEIPFILIVGPPIIWAIYRAFPNFRRQEETREKP